MLSTAYYENFKATRTYEPGSISEVHIRTPLINTKNDGEPFTI